MGKLRLELATDLPGCTVCQGLSQVLYVGLSVSKACVLFAKPMVLKFEDIQESLVI